MRSGIILAGGMSTRFGGGEKSLRPVDGKPMICRVLGALASVADEIIVSVRDEQQRDRVFPFLKEGVTFVYDEEEGIGPLAGVLSSLRAAKGEYAAVVACDMPFINAKAIALLFDEAQGHEAAVPVWENGLIEPLHAVYRREAMLRAVERSVHSQEYKIRAPLKRLGDVVYVSVARLRKVDPELKTFQNINRFEDMPGP